MKTTRTLSRLLLALAGFAFAFAGEANAANPVSGVSLITALKDAHSLAANRSDLKVLRVEGTSMLPYFGTGAVLVVKTLAAEKLRSGMVVVYTNRFNEIIAHRLVSVTANGWTAAGYNNSSDDTTPVTSENLIGVVYATFHSDAQASAPLVASTSVEAGTLVAMAGPAR
ncbi:signal peptidase I [Rariglobus hedericola]|uniref:Signal peptidase I n=1 Tax=Rariglobus hedericola TaxID=2597822 RepID=A0A556QNM8_9BACT|nr:signal peptidase I [Rariglobus hedericola]TSJ78245.1 signal peptidase I [Rariglobus hedericola]